MHDLLAAGWKLYWTETLCTTMKECMSATPTVWSQTLELQVNESHTTTYRIMWDITMIWNRMINQHAWIFASGCWTSLTDLTMFSTMFPFPTRPGIRSMNTLICKITESGCPSLTYLLQIIDYSWGVPRYQPAVYYFFVGMWWTWLLVPLRQCQGECNVHLNDLCR